MTQVSTKEISTNLLRVVLCQMNVVSSKTRNIQRAVQMIADAKQYHKADVVVLPECFNCPYGTNFFPEYAEKIPSAPMYRPSRPLASCPNAVVSASPPSSPPPSETDFADFMQSDNMYDPNVYPTTHALSNAARDNQVTVIGGSIPERHDEHKNDENAQKSTKFFNTGICFSPLGQLIGKHRKIHLFRLNTDTVKFDEAEVLSPGDAPTIIPMFKHVGGGGAASSQKTLSLACLAGVGICFDIRFPQLADYYNQVGKTSILFYPGAFNMVTGPKHWSLAARSRAVDNQQFCVLASPARDSNAGYVAWGHSLVVDPWGDTICEAGEGEEMVVADLDLDSIATIRRKLPILAGLRHDLYDFPPMLNKSQQLS